MSDNVSDLTKENWSIRAKEKIKNMSRKELNAETLHCWNEQDQLCREILVLKRKLEKAIEQRNNYVEKDVLEYGESISTYNELLDKLDKALEEIK